MKQRLLLFVLLLSLATIPQVAPAQLWVKKFTGGIQAFKIKADSNGNSYVLGAGKSTSYDIILVKYDTSGKQIWTTTYHDSTNHDVFGTSLAMDANANLYVTGWIHNDGALKYDVLTLKFNASGVLLWTKVFNGSADRQDQGVALALDNSLNLYVTALSNGGDSTQNDILLLKYDPNGNQKWAKRYNGPGNNGDEPGSVAVDSVGNIVICGYSVGDNNTGWDAVVLKYDTNGNRLWVRRFDNILHGFDYAFNLVLDSKDNIYTVGRSYASGSTGYDILLLKYDSKGNLKWKKTWNGQGTNQDFSKEIAVDSAGNVYITGSSYHTATRTDIVTAKYDTNGRLLWAKQYNGAANNDDSGNGIIPEPSGGCYVLASVQAVAGINNAAIIKYDKDGNRLWVRRYPHNCYVNSMANDAMYNLYATGIEGGVFVTMKFAP